MREPRSSCSSCGEKVARPWSDASAGILRERRPCGIHGSCFTEAGVRALAVSGRHPPPSAQRALDALRDRRVNALFAADLFNEGLDLPDVDTVLFLRPTESATVFLQQLGRGLRRTPVEVGADGPGLRRSPAQGVPLRPELFSALTGRRAAGSNGTSAGFSVPTLRLPDRHGPPVPADRPRQHQVADGQPLESDGCGTSIGRRAHARGVSRGKRRRPGGRSPSGFSLVDTAAPGRWVAGELWGCVRGPAAASQSGRSPTSTTHCAGTPIVRCCPTTPPPIPNCHRPSSGSRGCCSSRSGPTAGSTTPTRRGSRRLAPKQRCARSCPRSLT